MIKKLSLLYALVIFLIILVVLIILKFKNNSSIVNETFNNTNIKVKKAEKELDIHLIDEKDESDISPDYENDSILLSCFKKKQLDTFNKEAKYSTKLYYKKNGEVVGEVWITPSHIVEKAPQITLNGYFLNNLCVKKKYRRQGIAKELINQVISKAKKENKLHIILQVDLKKPFLKDFYSDMGFKTYISGIKEDGSKSNIMFLPL